MTAQPLPGLEAAVLTERQAQALAIVREHGPIRSDQQGVVVTALPEELREAR